MMIFGVGEMEVVDKDKLGDNPKTAALKLASPTQKSACEMFQFKLTTKPTTKT